MRTLVIAEHDNQNVAPATLSTIKAAQALNQEVDLLVACSSDTVLENAVKIEGISKVLAFKEDKFSNEIAEDIADCVIEVAADYNYFLASSSTTGKNNLPRFAALLDIQQISEVIEIIDNSTFKKPIYAGACIATVKTHQDKNILSIRTTAFEKVSAESGNAEIVSMSTPSSASKKARFLRNELTAVSYTHLTLPTILRV